MDREAVQIRFGILGTSAALHRAINRTRLVARTDVTVLIEGESGVGKELIANAVHGLSSRRHHRLLVLNMGSIPEGLIEAELFGAEKGAYSSSVERRIGYFEKASRGTIFLDEIGEMPPPMQVRLLRVLESGSFSRVGSSTVRTTDVRVVAATNKDLGREVQSGRFREDLYYRLSTVIIRLPPLRERQQDIQLLFAHFLQEFSDKYRTPLKRLEPEAVDLLQRYHWPGNVRELRNVAEAAIITLLGKTIEAAMLRPLLRGVATRTNSTALVKVSPQPAPGDGDTQERALLYRAILSQQVSLEKMRQDLQQLASGMQVLLRAHGTAGPPPSLPAFPVVMDANENFVGYQEPNDLEEVSVHPERIPTLVEAERELIQRALEHYGGNKRKTARALGISERSLYRKLKLAQEAVASDAS